MNTRIWLGTVILYTAIAVNAPCQLYDVTAVANFSGHPNYLRTITGEDFGGIDYQETGVAESYVTVHAFYGPGFAKIGTGGRARYDETIGYIGSAQSSISLSASDYVLMSNPALNGLRGTMTEEFYVVSSAFAGTATHYGSSNASTGFNLNILSFGSGSQLIDSVGVAFSSEADNWATGTFTSFTFPEYARFSLTFDFVWGVPYLLRFNMSGGGLAMITPSENQAAAVYDADMLHSFYLDGISQVTTNGETVTSYSATGLNGLDYRLSYVPTIEAVPEPTSSTAIGILVCAVLVVLRLRRRSCGDSIAKARS